MKLRGTSLVKLVGNKAARVDKLISLYTFPELITRLEHYIIHGVLNIVLTLPVRVKSFVIVFTASNFDEESCR